MIATPAERGDVVRYQSATPSADMSGNIEALSMWAGQSTGIVRKVQPVAEIIKEINAEAVACIQGLGSLACGD